MENRTYRLGQGQGPTTSKKQKLLMRLYNYKLPFISRFIRKQLKKSFNFDISVTIGPGFYSASTLLKVGKNTGLSDLYIHGNGDVEFGKGCHTSPKVMIVTTTHDFHDFGILKVKSTIIEDYVWIATGAKILQGVRIGRGSIIGAFSVVRRDIPPYSIVAGDPCKVVGFRYTPEEAVELEKNLYDEKERMPLDVLKSNYEKYYLNRKSEIETFFSI